MCGFALIMYVSSYRRIDVGAEWTVERGRVRSERRSGRFGD